MTVLQKQGADHSEKVHSSLATADSQQRELLGEQCIVVDESDKVIRSGSKKECKYYSGFCVCRPSSELCFA